MSSAKYIQDLDFFLYIGYNDMHRLNFKELSIMAKLVSKIVEIWHDRKRILGMPITFTRYALSNDRLFIRRGWLNIHQDEVLLYRVRDLCVKVNLWQRIFGVGTISIASTDKSVPTLILKNVRQPFEVKELIHENVERMKIERRMRIGEMSMDIDDSDMDFESDSN